MVLSTTASYSLVAKVTDKCRHLTYMIREEHDIQLRPCFSRIISEMPPEIDELESFIFFFQIYNSFSNILIVCYILNKGNMVLLAPHSDKVCFTW